MEKFIEDATKAYIISYNTTMEMTHNPNMAMQIAACIVVSYMEVMKPQEMQIAPMAAVMMAVGQAMTQRGTNDRCEDEDPKK